MSTSQRRFQDAIFIQQGACNPAGIALSLHNACKECIAEGVSQRTDPAVRLIAHQLAYLLNVYHIENDPELYHQLMDECESRNKSK